MSRFKGAKRISVNFWACYISVNYRSVYLGSFVSEAEAARAYDEACAFLGRKVHNFPDEMSTGYLKENVFVELLEKIDQKSRNQQD